MKSTAQFATLASMLWIIACATTSEEKQVECLQRKVQSESEQAAKLRKDYEAKINAIEAASQQLSTELRDEVANKQVTISKLEGRLTVSIVEDVLFEPGSAELHEPAQAVLDKVANALKNVKDKNVMIEGYTDDAPILPSLVATFPTNWELSTARATTVVRYLQDKGVDPKELGAAGYSMYRPLATNATPEGRHQNRRIDVVLTPTLAEEHAELSEIEGQ